jgi:hypothetical protein
VNTDTVITVAALATDHAVEVDLAHDNVADCVQIDEQDYHAPRQKVKVKQG